MKYRSIKWSSVGGLFVCLILATGGLLPFFQGQEDYKGLLVAAFFGLVSIFYAHDLFRASISKSEDSEAPGSEVSAAFSDTEISVTYGNGETRSITWSSLTKVGIMTTDEGPFVQDVFWGLHAGEEVAVVYPQNAKGARELLHALQARLPNFDNKTVIEAMGSTTNARFIVWEHDHAN